MQYLTNRLINSDYITQIKLKCVNYYFESFKKQTKNEKLIKKKNQDNLPNVNIILQIYRNTYYFLKIIGKSYIEMNDLQHINYSIKYTDTQRDIYDANEFLIKEKYFYRPLNSKEKEYINKTLRLNIFSYPIDFWKKSNHELYLDWEKNDDFKILSYDNFLSNIDNDTIPIVHTINEFNKHFNYFTENCLEGLNWNNLIVAGGAVMTCLFSMETQIKNFSNLDVIEKEIETYCLLSGADKNEFKDVKNLIDFEKKRKDNKHFVKNKFSDSDVDLYLIDLSYQEANEKIIEISNILSKNCNCEILTTRTKYTVSLTPLNDKYRTIQVILKIYDCDIKVISGFDVDPCCCYYNGEFVYGNQRFIDSMISKIIWINHKRQSSTYLLRLKNIIIKDLASIVKI